VLVATKQLAPIIFDATGWYQLSRGLFSLGYFRAAWVARENSLDLSIVEGLKSNSSSTLVKHAVEASLERLDFESAGSILKATSKLGPEALVSYGKFVGFLEGSNTNKLDYELNCSSVAELLFRDLVTDKKVALVGSGHPRGEYGDEIDSSESVARVKFVGVENLPDPKFHGVRCNIVYQAALNVLSEYSKAGVNINFYENIDIFVSDSTFSCFGDKPVKNIGLHTHMYRTTAISGLVMLYQLICAFPKAIKIYGYDFRVDRKQYSNAARDFYKDNGSILGHPYPGFDTEDMPSWIIAYDFTSHDFVSNFCFAQNLYKAGLFDIEPYGKSILELTPYQYVERLEEMLGDW